MVEWARANAALNGLGDAPIRWIVDDARKFMQREVRRGRRYDAVILAVAHKEFLELNVRNLVREGGVVYDVKGILPRDIVDGRL